MSTPDVVSDGLILAAVERAVRHAPPPPREGAVAGVGPWRVMEHLGLPMRSGRARSAKARARALEQAGAIQSGRRSGVVVWALTSAGRQSLERARRGEVLVLPESPQHRAWREARTLAGQEIDRFREDLKRDAESALWLLGRETPVESDAWFTLAERLQRSCWRVASATYCLGEWREPSDDRADIDDHLEPGEQQLPRGQQQELIALRQGRRNTGRWKERGR